MGTHKAPDREQGEHSQQDQDGRQQVAQAEQVGVIPGVFCHRGGLGLHGAGQLLGVLLRGQSLEQLGHGLDALHRLEPQAILQNVREVDRQGRVDGAGFGVGVRHQPLGGGHSQPGGELVVLQQKPRLARLQGQGPLHVLLCDRVRQGLHRIWLLIFIIALSRRHILCDIHQNRAGTAASGNFKGSPDHVRQLRHILYNKIVFRDRHGYA